MPGIRGWRRMTLPALVARAQAGDSDALSDLWRACSPGMAHAAHSVLPLPEDVEDAVSNAWLCILRFLDRYRVRPGVSFQSWANQVARNMALTLREAGGQMRGTSFAELGRDPTERRADLSPGPEAYAIGRAEARQIAAMIRRLWPEHVEALVAQLRGEPMLATAARLGVPIGTVKSRRHNAREALQGALEREGVRPHTAE
jgi:RNA polymerase sigma factor (sigma-70 family)